MKNVRELVKGQVLLLVQKEETVLSSVRLMAEKKVGSVAVMEGNRFFGIFTERDLMTRVVAVEKDPATLQIGDVCSTDVIIIAPDKTAESALQKMKKANIRHLPVVEGNEIIGIVSIRDVALAESHAKETVIRRMNEYLYHNP